MESIEELIQRAHEYAMQQVIDEARRRIPKKTGWLRGRLMR